MRFETIPGSTVIRLRAFFNNSKPNPSQMLSLQVISQETPCESSAMSQISNLSNVNHLRACEFGSVMLLGSPFLSQIRSPQAFSFAKRLGLTTLLLFFCFRSFGQLPLRVFHTSVSELTGAFRILLVLVTLLAGFPFYLPFCCATPLTGYFLPFNHTHFARHMEL